MKTSTLAMALALVATPALATTEAVMHRDPGCGCCVKWAEQVRKSFGRSVRIVDDANRPALQRRGGPPPPPASFPPALIAGRGFGGPFSLARTKRYAVVAFGNGKPFVYARH